MKKLMTIIVIGIGILVFTNMVTAGEKAPQAVVDLANQKLTQIGQDSIIVEAVKNENAKSKSLEQIKNLDATWKSDAGIADYMQAIMESECAKHLRSIQEGSDYFAEIFVMDNQGANVAMTDKTSDYWQGDEAKFKKSFADGQGAIFIDEVEFDDSAQAYLVQVSVPVKDSGKAIGAITFGIDIDRIDQ